MSRESLIILSGIIIIFTPHLGVPSEWKMYMYAIVGSCLLVIGYSLRRSAFRRRLERSDQEIGTDSFVESNGKPAAKEVSAEA